MFSLQWRLPLYPRVWCLAWPRLIWTWRRGRDTSWSQSPRQGCISMIGVLVWGQDHHQGVGECLTPTTPTTPPTILCLARTASCSLSPLTPTPRTTTCPASRSPALTTQTNTGRCWPSDILKVVVWSGFLWTSSKELEISKENLKGNLGIF